MGEAGRESTRSWLRRWLVACFLRDTRNVRGYGVEIDDANVLACFNNGVNVIQSDLSRAC